MERPNSPPPPPPPPSTGPSVVMFKPPTAQEEVVANAPNIMNKSRNNIPSPKPRPSALPSSTPSVAVAQLPGSMSPRGVRLEKIVGITATHNACLALNPITNEMAYPAGRTVVLHDFIRDTQTFHFHGSKTVSAIAWSDDGNTIAIGERGHQPGIVVWEKITCNTNNNSNNNNNKNNVSDNSSPPPPNSNNNNKVQYQRVAHLIGHTFGIKCMAFDKSGKYLVSVGFKHDHRIIVWEWRKELIQKNNYSSGSSLQHSGENNIPSSMNGNSNDNQDDATRHSNNKDGMVTKIDPRKVAVAKFTKRIHNIAFLDNYGFNATSSISSKEGKLDVVNDDSNGNVADDDTSRTFVTVADGGVIEYWVLNDVVGDANSNDENITSSNNNGNNNIKSDGDIISLIPKAGSAPKAFHKSNFVDAGTSNDGDLYTVTYDGNLCSFGKNGIMEKWVSLHSTAYSIEIGTDFIVVGCADGLVRIFQTKTLKYIGTLPLPAPLLAVGSAANKSNELDEGNKDSEFKPVKPVYPAALCVKIDISDTYVTVMYANRQLTTWNVSSIGTEEPNIVNSHLYHSGCIWDVNIPAASAARMHSINNGNSVHFGGSDLLKDGNISSKPIMDNAVITCSADGTIRFWDLERKKNSKNSNNNNGSSGSSNGSDDVVFDDFMLNILYADAKPSTLAPIPTVNTTTATSPKATALDTKSGLPLAGNSDNSNSKSVDASNLTYDAELPPKAEPNVGVRCIDVSPDGRWLASGDRQGRIRVHDLQNMSEYSNMKSHDAEVLSISFCPKPPPKGLDGSGKIHEVDVANARPFTQPSLLASGGRDRLVKIYDASQKFNHCKTIDNHSASVLGVKFALDGSRLLTCGGDRTIVISRVKTLLNQEKNEQAVDSGTDTFSGHAESYDVVRDRSVTVPYGTIYDMNVHENNRWIVTAGSEKKVQVWSLFSGKRLRSWKPTDGRTGSGPEVELYKIKLDATGTYAATCSFDKQVRIYDFLSGSCVARFSGHSELVTGVAFTADCRRLISVGGDGCIFVWRLPSAMTRAMRERREAKKIAVQRKKKEHAMEYERRKLEKEKNEVIVKSPRKKIVNTASPETPPPVPQAKVENLNVEITSDEKKGHQAPCPITDEEIVKSVSESMIKELLHQTNTESNKSNQALILPVVEPIIEVNDSVKKIEKETATKAKRNVNVSPPKSSKTNKMGEEAEDNNLMIVGKAVTRHPQKKNTPNDTSTQNTTESTVSTVNSTIASTSDLPNWAQTQGSGSSATQGLTAVIEDLPAWAKTQGKKTDGVVADVSSTSNNDYSTETTGTSDTQNSKNIKKKGNTRREKDIKAVQELDDVVEDDSGDSSATEIGDESLAAPLVGSDRDDEVDLEDNNGTENDVDSPPRPINTRSLAEERRALALRQRGEEASAAVADMRARLSALGILPVVQEKGKNDAKSEMRKVDAAKIIQKKPEEMVEKVVVATTDISTDISVVDLSVDTSVDVTSILDGVEEKDLKNSVTIADDEGRQKVSSSGTNNKPTIEVKVSSPIKKMEETEGVKIKSALQPPKSSASPKRRESSKSFKQSNGDSNENLAVGALRLSKPAEAYRASLANLREALSHCVEMYKEVDFVRQSLPSVPERSGVDELLKEFQEEFKGIVSEIPQQQQQQQQKEDQKQNNNINNDADGEEDSESEEESSSSEDENELQMLLSLAKKLNKKKKRKKMLRSSGKLKRRSASHNV